MYKRRYFPVHRDFPKGCGVFSGHNKSNADESKFKEGFVRVQSNVTDLKELSDHSETESLVQSDVTILESCGSVKGHKEKEVKQNETNHVKKRRLSLHNSTVDVVNTSKRIIVSGLASQSFLRQLKKRRSR